MKHHVWLVILALVVIAVLFVGGVLSTALVNDSRRHENCVSRQELYDGQFAIVEFIAGELHATPAELHMAEADLHQTLGVRPNC